MSLTVATALQLVNTDLIKGIGLNIFTRDNFLPMIPYIGVNRPTITFNYELSTGATDPQFITAGGAVTESAPTFTEQVLTIQRLVSDVSLPSNIEQLYTGDQDPLQISLSEKLKAFQRVIGKAIINGNGVSPNIQGLATYVANNSGSQLVPNVGTNGDALSLTTLDNLMYNVTKVDNNRVFLMNGQLLTKFSALMRAAGGNREMDWNGRMVQQYNGIPVIQTDWIPNTEVVGSYSTASSVYCVSLDQNDGAQFYCNEFEQKAGNGVVQEGMFQIKEVGPDPTYDLTKYRISTNIALFIRSPLAVGRSSGLITT